jgi:hypothetical protein
VRRRVVVVPFLIIMVANLGMAVLLLRSVDARA